jgi:hypothetical protein
MNRRPLENPRKTQQLKASLNFAKSFALLFFASSNVSGQNAAKPVPPPATQSEDVQMQTRRLEARAQQNSGAALEILRELTKFSGGGDLALKNAAAKAEAAIKRIKGDSASFEADLKKAREQLQKGREELQKIEGSADIVAVYLREKVEPLANRLTQSESVSRTALIILENTAKKIGEWQRVFATFSEVVGKEDAVKKIKELVDKEVLELSRK